MIITNLRKFEEVCINMKVFCKKEKDEVVDKIFNNVFFMENNLMCATNGKIMAVRNMSDCVINSEKFAFPINTKPKKVVNSDGENFIIENLKEDWFSKDKIQDLKLNWKKLIPTSTPTAFQEYDFTFYNFKITKQENKHPKVTFINNDVIFEYKDFYDTVATFSDFTVSDYMFECNYNNNIETVSFPMEQIEWILRISKTFILQQFESDVFSPRVFTTKDYKFIVSPMVA